MLMIWRSDCGKKIKRRHSSNLSILSCHCDNSDEEYPGTDCKCDIFPGSEHNSESSLSNLGCLCESFDPACLQHAEKDSFCSL